MSNFVDSSYEEGKERGYGSERIYTSMSSTIGHVSLSGFSSSVARNQHPDHVLTTISRV